MLLDVVEDGLQGFEVAVDVADDRLHARPRAGSAGRGTGAAAPTLKPGRRPLIGGDKESFAVYRVPVNAVKGLPFAGRIVAVTGPARSPRPAYMV